MKEDSAMNTLAPSQPSQEITKSRRIGVLIYPGCDILDLCGPCDAFHYANIWLPRFGKNRRTRLPVRYPSRHPWTGPDDMWNRDRRDPQLL